MGIYKKKQMWLVLTAGKDVDDVFGLLGIPRAVQSINCPGGCTPKIPPTFDDSVPWP